MKYLFFILLILSSCTIEKRLYRPGYYVSSNSRIVKNNESIIKKVVPKKVQQVTYKSIEKIEPKKEVTQITKQKNYSINVKKEINLIEKKQDNSVLTKKKNRLVKDSSNRNILSKKNSIKTETEESKTYEPLSNWALFFGFLSFLIVGCIPALILGALAKKKHKKNPDKYKNKYMANFGFGMGLFVTILLGFGLFISSIFDSSVILLLGMLVCLAAIVVALVIVL